MPMIIKEMRCIYHILRYMCEYLQKPVRTDGRALVFVRWMQPWPVNSPHKWPVTRKMFPFDDVIMSAVHTITWWRHNTAECRFNAVQYTLISHTALKGLKTQNLTSLYLQENWPRYNSTALYTTLPLVRRDQTLCTHKVHACPYFCVLFPVNFSHIQEVGTQKKYFKIPDTYVTFKQRTKSMQAKGLCFVVIFVVCYNLIRATSICGLFD